MALTCPSCGGFDISPEADRYHCLNCGNFFTYDNETASDGPGEPLFHPEEREVSDEVTPEPTNHEELAKAAQTGDEGIDSPSQSANVPDPTAADSLNLNEEPLPPGQDSRSGELAPNQADAPAPGEGMDAPQDHAPVEDAPQQ